MRKQKRKFPDLIIPAYDRIFLAGTGAALLTHAGARAKITSVTQHLLHNVERKRSMPPKVKFQKEEIVQAALNIARKKSIDAVTAREVAAELNVSPRPIFTYYESMDSLRSDVYDQAKQRYREYIEFGLQAGV
jgi:DNA-binding transcriptional regulator YbjK